MNSRLLKEIEERAKVNPEILGEILTLISLNWCKCVEAQKENNDSKHIMLLYEMVNNYYFSFLFRKKKPVLMSKASCATMLDTLSVLFPRCVCTSESEQEVLRHFAKSCRHHIWTSDCSFIKDIKKLSGFIKTLYESFPEE